MDLEAIWKRARADLLVPTARAEPDVFLWEHSLRVARAAEYILELPVVRVGGPDRPAVVAAALYHDAGWVVRARRGERERLEVLLGTSTEADREDAARMMETSLHGLLSRESLDCAVRAVRTFCERTTELLEARIIADADNLQEFGVLSLWTAARRGLLEGRGVQSVLDGWKRKKEYRFWAARLNDSFHFDAVREIARRRLERVERIMDELSDEHAVADLTAAPQDAKVTQT